MEAFSLVRVPKGVAPLLHGDFAVGLRSSIHAAVRGDFATGARASGVTLTSGDFATGFPGRVTGALPVGSFATAVRRPRERA